MARWPSLFKQPEDTGATIWRYLSLPSLICLLSSRKLHFQQIARFSDQYEGSVTRWLQESIADLGIHNERTLFMMRSRFACCASCWCLADVESQGLWRIYGKENGGVAIQTSYETLADLVESHTDGYIGKIDYIDYEENPVLDLESFNPIMHKRLEFQHEKEVRAVIASNLRLAVPDIERLEHDYPQEQFLEIDPEQLIHRVIVSPYAASWYREAVVAVIRQFAPRLLCEPSAMTIKPLQLVERNATGQMTISDWLQTAVPALDEDEIPF